MHDELSASATLDVRSESLPQRPIFWLSLYLGTMAALGPLAIDMYLPAFPRIAAAFGVQIPDVQRTLASYFIGLAIGQLIYGPLADRFGRKPPLYFGLILFTLCSAGCALTWNIPSLTLLRFMQALGGCAEMVIAR